ncbi:toll/interleukin-1 receptor domain-containing protein [Altererythrobacter sp.]|uniref:toll/interleukin-1 receptor domain-containing protein n=1 Tax=Altererythrobacter sp. TaxID=1872480 RepID=UPI003D0FE18C
MEQRHYRAFLSYSHRDKGVAEWLHRQLEGYKLPPGLAEANGAGALRPIFKDRDELPASENLGEAIESALANSSALIVLCSPSAAISPWIAREIDFYKRRHGDSRVFAAVVDGEPPYNMPPPLRVRYINGEPTGQEAEPVAADLRPEGDGRKLGLLKIAAGLAGVGLDALVDREAQRRHRRMALVAGLSFVGMVVAIALAVFAVQQRDAARAERAEANGLVEYMLTDLRDQLEPVGRLDLLDGVGAKALDYYARQKLDSLTPDELGRRAKAVQLVGEVQNLRGYNDKALPAFREAARTTGELLTRRPNDPERMFNHGQSLYWVGYITWQRGQMDEAKRALGEYADISTRLAAMDRANLDWQMEESYALSNLGTLANDEGRFDDSLPLFQRSVEIVRKVAEAENRPPARLVELGEGLSWVATTQQYLGDFKGSARTRQEEIDLYLEVLKADPENYDALRVAMFAEARMGWLLGLTGDRRRARRMFNAAVASADRLLEHDPEHTWTMEMAVPAFTDRAMLNWREGNREAASDDFDQAAAVIAELRKRDPKNRVWNIEKPAVNELLRALTDQSGISAASMHERAKRWLGKLDQSDSGHVWPIVAAHVVDAIGYEREGDRAAAAQAYARAIAVEDHAVGININALALRAAAAERLGQTALARQLRSELAKREVDPVIDDHLPTA